MTNKIRIGVAGIRGWAEGIHMRYIQANPAAELAAICGRDPARTAEVAHRHGGAQHFSDYDEMLAKASLDAVVVCVPDDLHYPFVMAALDRGLHVLCEKPLAMNVEQARAMRDRAVEAGVVNMSYFTFRWTPYYQKIKRLIDEGYIGRPLSCEFHFLEGAPGNTYHWQIDRRRSNGVLGDRGVHMIDLALWLVGDIRRVNARLVTLREWQPPVEGIFEPACDDARLMLDFADGAQGMIHASYVTYRADHMFDQRVVLHGDQGTLEADQPLFGSESSGSSLRGARYGERLFRELPLTDDPAKEAIYHKHMTAYSYDYFARELVAENLFIESIRNRQPVVPDFTDGLKAQEVIAAALESDRLGGWVDV